MRRGKVLCLLGMLLAMFSGDPLFGQVKVGVLGGVNLANLSVNVDPADEDIAQTRFLTRRLGEVGAVVRVSLPGLAEVQLEPMILWQGSRLEAGNQVTGKISLTYFSIPVLFRLNLVRAPVTTPYLIVGPEMGFLLRARATDRGEESDVKDQLKDNNLAVNFGIGIELPAGGVSVFFQGEFGVGVMDIDDSEAKSTFRTNSVRLMGGVLF